MNGLSLVVDVDDALDTPGQVWLDIDEDGVKEWAFEGQGYGRSVTNRCSPMAVRRTMSPPPRTQAPFVTSDLLSPKTRP